jgi:hypothetical protein
MTEARRRRRGDARVELLDQLGYIVFSITTSAFLLYCTRVLRDAHDARDARDAADEKTRNCSLKSYQTLMLF